MTSIGEYAFYYCTDLTNITLHEGMKSIGRGTFYQCKSLAEITAAAQSGAKATVSLTVVCDEHDSVTDEAVPATCTETGLTAGSHCAVCGKVFTAQTEILALGHSWGEASYAWSDEKKSVIATRICANDNTHVEVEPLASVLILPEALTQIGEEAFMGLAAEGVIVPEGCTRIGPRAFANCPSLIYVRIPASVKDNIAEDAFDGSDQVRIDWAE